MTTAPVVPATGRSRGRVEAKVLRAALEAIAELGPDRVRIKDIADHAGMSSGHVMYYFGDRDQILVRTLLLSEHALGERRDRELARAADVHRAIDVFNRLYLPTGQRDVRWSLWAQVIARPPTDLRVRRELRVAVDEWADALAALMTAAVDAGALPVIDASTVATRHCRFMDGLALEVLLGAPGRARGWAMAEASAAWCDAVGLNDRH